MITLIPKQLPAEVAFNGKVVTAVPFSDNDGQHIVLLTETGDTPPKTIDADFRKADLYAYKYTLESDKYQLKWQVHDFVRDCPVDISANFLPGTFAVTDLDNNGKAEIWLMYKTACRSDASSATLKIIMYEGAKKYAMRGVNKVDTGNKNFMGGQYTLDNAFKNAPTSFREYALKLWKNNLMETWK